MGKKGSRTYTVEFKQQTVALAEDIGYAKASRQLGVNVSNIYGWKEKLKESGSMPINRKENQINYQEEYRRLQKENAELKKINIILKSAAAFFSQDHLK